MDAPTRPHLFGLLAGLFLAAGLVFSAMVCTRAWMRIAEGQSISVTGLARKNVRADLAIWRGTFSTEATTLLEAQQKLRQHLAIVEGFVRDKGLSNAVYSAIGIQELHVKADEATRTTGYRLQQTVEIRSENVSRMATLSGETTTLVEQGVAFVPAAPEYLYTKAGEAKLEMLAEATKDARGRAEQIAVQGGRQLGGLRSAKMGVFQITPLYSTETSWSGVNDTTSVDKTVAVTVAATFAMQ